MWIKRKGFSLYISMLLQMTLSTLLSIVVFLSLVGLSHYLQQSGNISLFESIKSVIISEAHHVYAGIFSIFLFFLLSFFVVTRIVSYVKLIEAGIKKLPDDKMNHSIPVIGRNELAHLAQSVNEIKAELEQKRHDEKMHELHQRTLITNISHDLRTPLTSIIGYLDLAKNTTDTKSETFSYLQIAEKNSLRLKKLITDLFLFSKIISEDIETELQEVNILFLLNQIIELKNFPVKFIHPSKELKLFINIECFHRVVDNLFENAHKYGLAEKEIQLCLFEADEKVIIEVKNFSQKDLSSKIDLFTQRLYSADENRDEYSSGLGLSIVSELMKRMQGEFTVSFEKEEKVFCARLSFVPSSKKIPSQ